MNKMEITYLHKNHIFKIKTNSGAAIRHKGVHVSMRKKKAEMKSNKVLNNGKRCNFFYSCGKII